MRNISSQSALATGRAGVWSSHTQLSALSTQRTGTRHATLSSVPIFSEDWLTRAQTRVNADPELNLIGGWFTVAFSLTSAERRAILRFERGRLVEAIATPRIDTRCAFGFRAS